MSLLKSKNKANYSRTSERHKHDGLVAPLGHCTQTYPTRRLHSAESAPLQLHRSYMSCLTTAFRFEVLSRPERVREIDLKSAHDLTARWHPLAVPSSLEAPTIFPGTGDPESDLVDGADNRGGVEATDIDENDSEGESEGTRCCDIFCSAVS